MSHSHCERRLRLLVLVVPWLVAVLAILAPAAPASAHEFRARVVTIEPLDEHRYRVLGDVALELVGSSCTEAVDGAGALLICPDGLDGRVGSPAISPNTQVYVRVVAEPGGGQRELVLSLARPTASFTERGPAQPPLQAVASGVIHILSGLDHLLVVLGIFVLLPQRRRRLLAITGFTVGHCISLLAVALGGVALPAPLVEAGIALSVGWLGVELVQNETTALVRRPLGLALVIGLLHGLGFGGAIEAGAGQVGLVAGFNLGIELGQLAVLATLAGAVWAVRTWVGPFDEAARRGGRLALGYALGVLGVAWAWERIIS